MDQLDSMDQQQGTSSSKAVGGKTQGYETQYWQWLHQRWLLPRATCTAVLIQPRDIREPGSDCLGWQVPGFWGRARRSDRSQVGLWESGVGVRRGRWPSLFTSFREYERARACYRAMNACGLWKDFEERPAGGLSGLSGGIGAGGMATDRFPHVRDSLGAQGARAPGAVFAVRSAWFLFCARAQESCELKVDWLSGEHPPHVLINWVHEVLKTCKGYEHERHFLVSVMLCGLPLVQDTPR